MDSTLDNSTIVASWAGQFDNCYVTQDEADKYLVTKDWWSKLWSDATTLAKVACLIQATMDIDGVGRWFNEKFFVWQSLQFPRYTNVNGWLPSGLPDAAYYDYIQQDLDQLDMSRRVKKATCEQAFWIMRQGGVNDDLERQQAGISHFAETIGPIHESVSYVRGAAGQNLCKEAIQYLKVYLSQPKLVRA